MWRIPSADSPRERLSYIDCLLRDVPTDTSERQAGSLSCLHQGTVWPCPAMLLSNMHCLHRAQCGHVRLSIVTETGSFSDAPAQKVLSNFRARVCRI